jgi:hypothetical protein
MEALAIISHLLHYALALAALYCCVTLFRRQRQVGWLFVSAVFLEPFVLLLMRAFHSRPLLRYKTIGDVGPDGVLNISYNFNFPFLYILAVAGLFILVREVRRG